MNEECELTVFGRVQGVGFRAMVSSIASKFNVKGKVQNNEDGSVTIVCQAEREILEKYIAEVIQGPGLSSVEGLSCHYRQIREKYDDFAISRTKNYISDKLSSIVNLGKNIVSKGSGNVPVHVAIIPDGNRRWAREKGKSPSYGHYTAGSYEHMNSLFEEARRLGIKYLSIWGFSTENWKRSKDEIKSIFDVILEKVNQFSEDAKKQKICFRHIRRKDRLPSDLLDALQKLEDETKGYSEFYVQLVLDYGGRDEIIRAVNKMLALNIKKIDEGTFNDYLDTRNIPDPDLIIRTSGEKRTSGLMPYQGTYSELFFSEKYFPDFSAEDLREIVDQFSMRVRRFGATAKEDLKIKKS